MPDNKDFIHKRIKYIRKSKRRSIHDCASVLGISNEMYHSIESGETPLTLPELELLAIYLGEKPTDLLTSEKHPQTFASVLEENNRSKFVQIRGKMLRALIAIERDKQAVSIEDVHLGTDIPLENLHAYDGGSAEIPLDDVIKICNFLELPLDALHAPLWPTTLPPEASSSNQDWNPEFVLTDADEQSPADDSFNAIVIALKKLPQEDQAYIAKYLLTKLRST